MIKHKNLTKLWREIQKKRIKKSESRYFRFKNKDYLKTYEKKRYKIRKHKVLEYNKRSKAKTGFVIRGGYKYIACPNHPNCTNQGQILEHRFVMEWKLKRLLKKSEIVHHIDGNKLNNHPDNLELLRTINDHAARHYTDMKINIKNGRFVSGMVSSD